MLLPGTEGGHRPASVGLLFGEELFDQRLAGRFREDFGHGCPCPQKHDAIVQRLGFLGGFQVGGQVCEMGANFGALAEAGALAAAMAAKAAP
jgi:hypothetical protein